MAAAAILDNFEWPHLHNSSRSTYIAVIFAIAQLSCLLKLILYRTYCTLRMLTTRLLVRQVIFSDGQSELSRVLVSRFALLSKFAEIKCTRKISDLTTRYYFDQRVIDYYRKGSRSVLEQKETFVETKITFVG